MHYEPCDYLREALNWNGPDGSAENGYWLMKEIGRLYGKTSHEVGKKLKELGYRTRDSKPSRKAYSERLVAPRHEPKFTWAWHKERTCAILEAAGWIRK